MRKAKEEILKVHSVERAPKKAIVDRSASGTRDAMYVARAQMEWRKVPTQTPKLRTVFVGTLPIGA